MRSQRRKSQGWLWVKGEDHSETTALSRGNLLVPMPSRSAGSWDPLSIPPSQQPTLMPSRYQQAAVQKCLPWGMHSAQQNKQQHPDMKIFSEKASQWSSQPKSESQSTHAELWRSISLPWIWAGNPTFLDIWRKPEAWRSSKEKEISYV